MVTINKTTIAANVWETLYDTMLASVTSVTLADASIQTVVTCTSSFPDKTADTKASYPILVINPVQISWDNLTFGKKWAIGSFDIDIFATKSEAADLFFDKIVDTIETNRGTYRSLGMAYIKLDSSTVDEFFRGDIKVHVKTAHFTFKLAFTQTRTW
jgi:hypothetical protein